MRNASRKAVAEQFCEQFVGVIDVVGVVEGVEIHEQPADHGERERCSTPGPSGLGTVGEKARFEDG